MLFKRMFPLVLMLILAGCFRQAEDTFDTVGSQNTGAITITQNVATIEATSDVTIIDPNSTDVPTADSSSVEASATPRVIVSAPTDIQVATINTQAPAPTDTAIVIPTATIVVASNTPQLIPTATEATFITPEVVVQATQITATPTVAVIESTLQPTPTAIGAELVVGDCEYEVQNGDNLFRISLNNNVGLASLLTANGLTEASIIQPGEILTIPNCEDDENGESTDDVSVEVEPTAIILDDCDYEIESGDTLFSIAIENGVTLAALLAENNLVENSIIQPGQLVTIPNCEDGEEDSASTEATTNDSTEETETVEEEIPEQTLHTVASGDTLISIARFYGVSVNDILQSNSIPDPNNLTTGQQLVIPDPASEG